MTQGNKMASIQIAHNTRENTSSIEEKEDIEFVTDIKHQPEPSQGLGKKCMQTRWLEQAQVNQASRIQTLMPVFAT